MFFKFYAFLLGAVLCTKFISHASPTTVHFLILLRKLPFYSVLYNIMNNCT